MKVKFKNNIFAESKYVETINEKVPSFVVDQLYDVFIHDSWFTLNETTLDICIELVVHDRPVNSQIGPGGYRFTGKEGLDIFNHMFQIVEL